MIVLEFVEAALWLGLPMAGLSWFLFSWLYNNGDIDREADQKSTKEQLKTLGKSFKKEKKLTDQSQAAYVYGRWAAFGGGFYGLAALWTFVVIEVSQSISFVFHFPGFAELFEHGLISFAVELLINQLGNIVSAFVWFAYWPSDTMIIWVLVAYLGYRLGVKLAKQEKQLDIDELWRKFFDK
ncbi:MAG: hypothetical protein ACJAY7_001093 [Pseudohongiellaceae bacterium]|jgi:hypothetical protein